MADRQLATVRTVKEVLPIEGADNIVCAKIDGWQCVVKKGEFQPGDPCLFIEVDALLNTADPRFAFLAPKAKAWKDGLWARLRTIKLKKTLSQGLALPLKEFTNEVQAYNAQDTAGVTFSVAEGHPFETLSLAQLIGIEKWEEEISPQLRGLQKGTFPHFLRKSDQERIQNIYTPELADVPYEATIKMDGTSLTVYARTNAELAGAETGVCSRNMELKNDADNQDNLYVRAARITGLLEKLSDTNRNLAVQAEICGPGIQANRAKLDKVAVYLYDVFDIDAQRFLGVDERLNLVGAWLTEAAEIPLRHVPVIGVGLQPQLQTLQAALNFSSSQCLFNGELAEGVVYKRLDGADSFKVISNEYLLKHGL